MILIQMSLLTGQKKARINRQKLCRFFKEQKEKEEKFEKNNDLDVQNESQKDNDAEGL